MGLNYPCVFPSGILEFPSGIPMAWQRFLVFVVAVVATWPAEISGLLIFVKIFVKIMWNFSRKTRRSQRAEPQQGQSRGCIPREEEEGGDESHTISRVTWNAVGTQNSAKTARGGS